MALLFLLLLLLLLSDKQVKIREFTFYSWGAETPQGISSTAVCQYQENGIEMTLPLSQKIPAGVSDRSWREWEGPSCSNTGHRDAQDGWRQAGRWKQELMSTLLMFPGFPSSAGSFPERLCQRALLIPVPAELPPLGLHGLMHRDTWELPGCICTTHSRWAGAYSCIVCGNIISLKISALSHITSIRLIGGLGSFVFNFSCIFFFLQPFMLDFGFAFIMKNTSIIKLPHWNK